MINGTNIPGYLWKYADDLSGPECFGLLKWNYHVEEIVNPIEALKIWLRGIGSVLQILHKISSQVCLACILQQSS